METLIQLIADLRGLKSVTVEGLPGFEAQNGMVAELEKSIADACLETDWDDVLKGARIADTVTSDLVHRASCRISEAASLIESALDTLERI